MGWQTPRRKRARICAVCTLCLQTVSVIRLNSIRLTFACVVAVCAGVNVCVWCVRELFKVFMYCVQTVCPPTAVAAQSQQYTIHCSYIIALLETHNSDVFFIEISVHIILVLYFQCRQTTNHLSIQKYEFSRHSEHSSYINKCEFLWVCERDLRCKCVEWLYACPQNTHFLGES